MPSVSKFDSLYRSLLLSKFFIRGWGDPHQIKKLFQFRQTVSNREKCKLLVPSDYPIHIDKVEENSQYKLLEGHFVSPFVHYLPEVVPKECVTARFQALIPTKWKTDLLRPMCIHLAGTGDHYYWKRRTLIAKPLLKESGVASIILENPFYGSRKPKEQSFSSLHNVSDIFVMGGCLALESLALLHWCENEGFGPLALTGISMGGHMASIGASNWHKPVSLIPCLSWTTASHVFTQGVMSGAIPWSLLQSQYFSDHIYKDELLKMVHSPEENSAFMAGYHFSSNYVENMESLLNQTSTSSDSNKSSPINVSSDYTYLKLLTEYTQKLDIVKSLPRFLGNDSGKEGLKMKVNKKIDIQAQKEYIKKSALNFMRGIMDECTHLGNFSVPVDPSLIIIIAAMFDGYVPREGIKGLPEIWPGCEVRYIDCGHIAAFLFNQSVFRKAIVDSLDRNARKYYQRSLIMSNN